MPEGALELLGTPCSSYSPYARLEAQKSDLDPLCDYGVVSHCGIAYSEATRVRFKDGQQIRSLPA